MQISGAQQRHAAQHQRAAASSARTVSLYEHVGAPRPELVLVVPFAHKEVPHLEANLHLWSSVPACRAGEPLADLHFVGSVHESDLSAARGLLRGMPQASFIKCFRQINYTLSDLKPADDVYPFAPNWVFFWMMLDSGLAEGGYKYIMQHELDVHPIAEMWLNTLLSTAATYTSGRSARPWVIGAGKVEWDASTRGRIAHVMNGNAVYVNDPQFLQFLRRFRAHFSCEERAYDTSMGHFLVDEGLDPDAHFIITPRIVNCDGHPLEQCARKGAVLTPSDLWLPISPETVLVHVKGVNRTNWAYFQSLVSKGKPYRFQNGLKCARGAHPEYF